MSRLPQIAIARRKPYPSDLSDAEWKVLEPLLPKPKGFGHPRCGDSVQVEVSERKSQELEILPKRWIVERTVGWLNRFRRLSKDCLI